MSTQGNDFTITLSDMSVPLDVYVMKDKHSDPNKWDYDLKFMGVKTSLKLKTVNLPSALKTNDGFTISIYAQGIAAKMNMLLDVSFHIEATNNRDNALFIE